MNQPIRIFIADDHPFFTEGVINALKPYVHYEIVGTATNGKEALKAIQELQPQITILDINMPGQNGLELIEIIKIKYPTIKIMVLSMYMPADIKLQPEKAGIDAYVLKNSGTDTLLAAIESLTQNTKYFDANIEQKNNHSEDGFSKVLKLSSREKEILAMIKAGNNTKAIATTLFISELTVKTHRKNIMAKMGAKNVADLVNKS